MENKKIYARQVSPEYQESLLFSGGCGFENITVTGNRDFKSHIQPVFERVKDVLDEGSLAEELDYLIEHHKYPQKQFKDLIEEHLPPEKESYSHNDIQTLSNLVVKYCMAIHDRQYSILCEVLSIVTDAKWSYSCIRGCCQSDWQYVFYDTAMWSEESIACFEKEYFNLGTEWIVHDEENVPECAEDVSGYHIYCYGDSNEEIRKEIAEWCGCETAEVTLYAYDHSERVDYFKAV